MLLKLIITLLLVSASAYVDVPPSKNKFMNQKLLIRQRSILEVFQHVLQDEVHTQLWEDSKDFSIEESLDSYSKVEVVEEFLYLNNQSFISLDDTFNIQNEAHKQQALALANTLKSAKNWDTFYLTMGWAR